ncbi:hypothetical protein EV401DRAFT_1911066, partial [Pisolithus croceorrhizus]
VETYITELRGKLSQEVAPSICNQINTLPLARFAARRLHLPYIVCAVYRAGVSGLGTVEFTTADDLPLQMPQKLIFVHPWIPYIRGPSDGDAWERDSVYSEGGTGSDEVLPPSPLHAIPVPQVDHYTRALQMIARLGQPFDTLLLVQQSDRHYKRVSTENEIVVPGLRTDITSRNIRMAVLEIL